MTFGAEREVGNIPEEDLQICKEAASYFEKQSPAKAARDVVEALWGDWYDEAMEARVQSPRFEEFPIQPGIPSYEMLLGKGLKGIRREAQEALDCYRKAQEKESDPEKIYFWKSVIIVCDAVVSFGRRHSELARRLAREEQDHERRKQLERMTDACEWVPENQPRTFFEAVQSFRLISAVLLLENGRKAPDLGRLDQLLFPLFKQDLEGGRLSLEEASDIIGDYITYVARLESIREAMFGRVGQQATMVNHITLGGMGRDGQEASNELTYLIIHTLGLLRYAEPHASLRVSQRTPRWLLLKGLETNQKVNGVPMYLNDDHITNYIHERGIPIEDARDWAVQGCSQPMALPQRFYHAMQINTALPLDLALHNGVAPVSGKRIGVETGDPSSFRTFEKFYEAYKTQYDFVVRRLTRIQRLMHLVEMQRHREPLRSALDAAGLANGRSHLIGGCGAYPLWYLKDRGMVAVSDSLLAIRKLVFEEKKLTMKDLVVALDSNFEGDQGQKIRRMCLQVPKYGNDIDEADYMLRDLAKFTASVISSEKNVFGWPYAINRNGVAWHVSAGKGVGALPSGRNAWSPLTDGSLSPMVGMDKKGPTAVMNSAIRADFKEAAVSILNQKFPLAFVHSPESMDKVADFTLTFIRLGGSHIQYNFLDRKTLLEAKKHPENYRDLVVRVAGYSAYFVHLSPELQDEIIARSEQWI